MIQPTRQQVIELTTLYEPELFLPGSLVSNVRTALDGLEIMTVEGWRRVLLYDEENDTLDFSERKVLAMPLQVSSESAEYTAPRRKMTLLDLGLLFFAFGFLWSLIGYCVYLWARQLGAL